MKRHGKLFTKYSILALKMVRFFTCVIVGAREKSFAIRADAPFIGLANALTEGQMEESMEELMAA